MKPKPPCKDCEDRTVGCHSKCTAYIEYKQKFDKWQSELKEEKYQNWLYHHSYDRMVSRKKGRTLQKPLCRKAEKTSLILNFKEVKQ